MPCMVPAVPPGMVQSHLTHGFRNSIDSCMTIVYAVAAGIQMRDGLRECGEFGDVQQRADRAQTCMNLIDRAPPIVA